MIVMILHFSSSINSKNLGAHSYGQTPKGTRKSSTQRAYSVPLYAQATAQNKRYSPFVQLYPGKLPCPKTSWSMKENGLPGVLEIGLSGLPGSDTMSMQISLLGRLVNSR